VSNSGVHGLAGGHKRSVSSENLPDEIAQVLVVGAGPVGLFAGLAADHAGLDVLVIDQVWRGFEPGHAALLHGRSLALMSELGLAERLRESGNEIDCVEFDIDGRRQVLQLASPALAIPQKAVEQVLMNELIRRKVDVRSPYQAATILQQRGYGHVDVRVIQRELVTLGSPAHYSEWGGARSSLLRADFVIGADGYHSRVREALGIEATDVGSSESFAMFEFQGGEAGSSLRLQIQDGLANMSFPLAGGRTRATFQVADSLDLEADLERLRSLTFERMPRATLPSSLDFGSVMHFERRLARRFGKGRVWLAGDAAHVTSPLGNQSMNSGIQEASALVARITQTVGAHGSEEPLRQYGVEREREWHKLLGLNVRFDLLPHAAPWLATHARRLLPHLPASGKDLTLLLEQLGLRLS
jgi:2-polyprenyl-6-methoxyphenol hydroxylase-like FAD-dependent oxidoreductase